MNKWKNYLHRWTPGRGRKEGKKNLAQTSLSLESSETSDRCEEVSLFRNSISVDATIIDTMAITSSTAIEVLSHASIDSPQIDNFDRLIVSSSPEEEASSTTDQPPINQSPTTKSIDDRSAETIRDSNFSTSELDGYLSMTPFDQIPPPSTPSLQAHPAIPPPSMDKSRQTRDGYIPLDTCSSGKRIASFKLEQEERFNEHHNRNNNSHHHSSLFTSVPPEYIKTLSCRPCLPSKDLYCLESVPPIPTNNNHGPPLPTKLNGSVPPSNRRRLQTIHVTPACGGDANQSSPPWNSPAAANYDKRNLHHDSLHCSFDRHQMRNNDSNHFGDYVACDANNNNNNNNNKTHVTINHDFFSQHSNNSPADERLSTYYNSTVGSLHRHFNSSSRRLSPGVLDTKDLLRIPVPPPRSAFNRYHSYANDPRSNSFKRIHLEKTQVEPYHNFRRKIEDCLQPEFRDLPPFPRRAKKTSMSRMLRTTYSDDADSLDGSSNHETCNDENGSMSDFKSSDDPFNVRFAPKAKKVSKSMYEGRPLPNVEIKYLQLNLQQTPEDASETSSINKIEPERVSNYREIDWLKTKALMETMHARTKVKGTGAVIST